MDEKTKPADVLDQALTDLRLYRAQWKRILATTLSFLEVQAGDERLYTIGVTQRAVEERVAEIGQELRAVTGDVAIRVLGTWPQRGNVERYFKHRYRAHQQRPGSLTEYFAFDDAALVLRDLRRMTAKDLPPLERAILADEPSAIQQPLALKPRPVRWSSKPANSRRRSWPGWSRRDSGACMSGGQRVGRRWKRS
ncbi:MAG TPA: hypothetical protein VFZ66_13550 [Herpetosiphonaceae bacterium]